MKPLPISIWQPLDEDGATVWVRPPPGPFGDHYATRRELRPKHAELPLRVVLFGESVAAGYLYAPHLTPAGVLEAQLQGIGGSERFEVIDLARTNETLGGLLDTVRAALQVNPDVLVLFVGNNWSLLETPEISPHAAHAASRQAFGAALRAEGLAGPIRLARERLHEAAGAVFAEIALIASTVGIPVVVVIPEVNLADWENRQPVAWLPGDGVARWHRLYDQAVAALDRGEHDAAIAAASSMQTLDGAASPTAWRLLARAREGLGDCAGAAVAARAEVSATVYPTMAFLAAPQASPEIQELLRSIARRHRCIAVDLPEVFAIHTDSPLPGRRLFLDYCHLTAEGMRVAMAAVAAAVLDVSGMIASPPEWREILDRVAGPEPSAEAEAIARFGAAIHSAHRLLTIGSKAPPLEHWCRGALAAAPGIAATLLDVAEARLAPCPAVLTAAHGRNAASSYPLLLQHGWRWDHLDADLLAAIRAVLSECAPDAAAQIDRLLGDRPGIPADGVDLAAPPLHALWEPLERFYPELMGREGHTLPAYLRCPWPETSFALLSAAEQDLEIDLTVRLPPAPGATARTGTVDVMVNGRPLGSIPATERWSRARLRLARAAPRPGLDRLTLRWPHPPPVDGDPFAVAVARLAAGLAADLHPVFGEVFSLRLCPVPGPAARS